MVSKGLNGGSLAVFLQVFLYIVVFSGFCVQDALVLN